MICPKRFDLQSYVDEELTPHQMRAIKRHLDHCGHCRDQVAEWNQVVDQLRQAFTVVDVPKVEADATRWIRQKQKRAIAAAAVIVVSLGLSTFWFLNGLNYRDDPRETELMKEYLILHMEELGADGGGGDV